MKIVIELEPNNNIERTDDLHGEIIDMMNGKYLDVIKCIRVTA